MHIDIKQMTEAVGLNWGHLQKDIHTASQTASAFLLRSRKRHQNGENQDSLSPRPQSCIVGVSDTFPCHAHVHRTPKKEPFAVSAGLGFQRTCGKNFVPQDAKFAVLPMTYISHFVKKAPKCWGKCSEKVHLRKLQWESDICWGLHSRDSSVPLVRLQKNREKLGWSA